MIRIESSISATPLFSTPASLGKPEDWKTPSVYPQNSHSGTHSRLAASLRPKNLEGCPKISSPPLFIPPQPVQFSTISNSYLLSLHKFAHSFARFCTLPKINPCPFNSLRTLCQYHPGWGVGSRLKLMSRSVRFSPIPVESFPLRARSGFCAFAVSFSSGNPASTRTTAANWLSFIPSDKIASLPTPLRQADRANEDSL